MNKNIKKFSFVDDVYGIKYICYIGDAEDAEPYLNRHKCSVLEDSNLCATTFFFEEEPLCVLWFSEIVPNSISLSQITHETFHIAIDVLTGRDIVLTDNNHELFAYYQQFLFRKILEKSL